MYDQELPYYMGRYVVSVLKPGTDTYIDIYDTNSKMEAIKVAREEFLRNGYRDVVVIDLATNEEVYSALQEAKELYRTYPPSWVERPTE
jgi:hypothetical protein